MHCLTAGAVLLCCSDEDMVVRVREYDESERRCETQGQALGRAGVCAVVW